MTDQSAADATPTPIEKLRERAALAGQLERELAELRTEYDGLRTDVALRGLGLSDVQRDALLSVHKGDMTPESVRETADALFPERGPQVSYDEQAAHARMAAATAAAPPSEAYSKTLSDVLSEARSADEVRAILDREGMIAYP